MIEIERKTDSYGIQDALFFFQFGSSIYCDTRATPSEIPK